MPWQDILLRIFLSGGVIVAASEIAKRNSLFGAFIISLPLASIMTLIWLYHDTGDAEQIAVFSKEVMWLVLPSFVLFISLPILLIRGFDFWMALLISTVLTAACYLLGVSLLGHASASTPTP